MKNEGNSDQYSEPDASALQRAYKLWRREPEKALDELRRLAEQGSRTSMLYLGEAFAKGRGASVDLGEAENWYRQAAELGSLFAYYSLGRMYLNEGRNDDAREAIQYAANMRYVPALHFLGRMYFAGKGVSKDPEKAKQLLNRAADAGNVMAKAALAQYFLRREATPSEKLRGVGFWFAARFGFFVAIFTEGVTSDRFR